MLRLRDVGLGALGAVAILIGPTPDDFAALFEHPAPPCLQSAGCGHTNAWWDRPVLVAHPALGATLPPSSTPPPAVARDWPPGPAG